MIQKYSITTPEDLRELCIKHHWFSAGTNRQYEKLFFANANGYTLEEIATIIWVCTDCEPGAEQEILAALKEARDDYMTLQMGGEDCV